MIEEKVECPVCRARAVRKERNPIADMSFYDCDLCGSFRVSGTAISYLGTSENPKLTNIRYVTALGFWLQQRQTTENHPLLTVDTIKALAKNPYLPSVSEQIELLVQYVGNHAGGLGVQVNLDGPKLVHKIGMLSERSLKALVDHLELNGLFETIDTSHQQGCAYLASLTVAGWLKFEQIASGKSKLRSAFMAMPFNDDELDNFWLPALRNAISETGFNLKRVDEDPKSGLIDVRMRLQIKEARFLIVDLTHSNNGAYWEAGFAEGLGKPVIYTCKKGTKAHFDVDHSLRVEWDSSDLQPALTNIKSIIRNEFSDAEQEQFM